MMERMSAKEFKTWAAIFRLRPPGDRLVASLLFNIHKRSEVPLMEPHQYMNAMAERKPAVVHRQSAQEIAAILSAAAPKEPRKRKRKATP
jgi:hypothetical protein